jgi:hypothetical protein
LHDGKLYTSQTAINHHFQRNQSFGINKLGTVVDMLLAMILFSGLVKAEKRFEGNSFVELKITFIK